MQNFTLLTEAGKQDKPVRLKRGIAATIKEWIGAAEYIAVVPIIKKETNLPVIVDPSHSTGIRDLIKPMSIASLSCGEDGIMIEVHPNSSEALSDVEQFLNFEGFDDLMKSIKKHI